MIFNPDIEPNLRNITIMITNIAVINMVIRNRICSQMIFAVSLDFIMVQVPGIGERIGIICRSVYSQVKRLTLLKIDILGGDFLIHAFDPCLQLIFYINIKMNRGIVTVLISSLTSIRTIFCHRTGDQSIRAIPFDFCIVQKLGKGYGVRITGGSTYFSYFAA